DESAAARPGADGSQPRRLRGLRRARWQGSPDGEGAEQGAEKAVVQPGLEQPEEAGSGQSPDGASPVRRRRPRRGRPRYRRPRQPATATEAQPGADNSGAPPPSEGAKERGPDGGELQQAS